MKCHVNAINPYSRCYRSGLSPTSRSQRALVTSRREEIHTWRRFPGVACFQSSAKPFEIVVFCPPSLSLVHGPSCLEWGTDSNQRTIVPQTDYTHTKQNLLIYLDLIPQLHSQAQPCLNSTGEVRFISSGICQRRSRTIAKYFNTLYKQCNY